MGRGQRGADNLSTYEVVESAVLVRNSESALWVLPTYVVASYPTGAAFNTGIICDRDLVLFPFVDIRWAHAYACEVKGALQTHFRVLDPQM